MNKVIVIEDDKDVGMYLRELLSKHGYVVKLINDGATAIKNIENIRPDLVLLDLGLPTVGGETVCSEVKSMYPDLPIIILTARGGSSNIVRGLRIGADDYIAKPFESEELLARIQAALRAYNIHEEKLTVSDLELNSGTMEVSRAGKAINLTAQEFKLLEVLISNKGRVLSRDLILNRIWKNWSKVDTRVVDVYIGYLRKKIDFGFKKKLIQSVRGFGYTIKD